MNKLRIIIFLTILVVCLSSCADAQEDNSLSAITIAPSSTPFPFMKEAAAVFPTPEPTPDEPPIQVEIVSESAMPAPTLQQRTYLLYSNNAMQFATPTFGFYANCDKKDDTLFQAIYKSLSSTSWTTVSEGVSNFEAYLPDGVKVDDFYITEKVGLERAGEPGYKEPAITKHVRKDLNLAYIAIENRDWNPAQGNSTSAILLLFDIRDGYYAPYGGIRIGTSWPNKANSYFITGAGGMRWVVESSLWLHGTGKWREGSEWWNIDERSVDIAYAYWEGDELERTSMGIICFDGQLNKPKVSSFPDRNLLRFDFIQSLNMEYNGYDGEDMMEPKVFEKELPLTIWYDISCRRAFIEDTSADHWYLGNGFYAAQSVYDLFADELRQLAKDTADPAAPWAEWMLVTPPRDAGRDSSRELWEAYGPF